MGAWLHEAWQLGWSIAIIAVLLLCFQTGVFFYIWCKFDNALIDWMRNIAKHSKKEHRR